MSCFRILSRRRQPLCCVKFHFPTPNGTNPDNRAGSCLRASRALKDLPIAAQKAIFADLDRDFSRFDGFRETPVMSLDEIRQIATTHEIGAHSFEHASMAAETDDYLLEDMRRCRDYFMNLTRLRTLHLCLSKRQR